MKTLLSGWTFFEKVWLTIFTAINVYLFFAFDDTIVGLTASLTGMLCVVLVAKGRISNYAFGAVNTALYAYIAYNAQIYGDFMLNAFFYFPIQFIGFYMWNKHKIKKQTETVVKAERLTVDGWIKLSIITFCSWALYAVILTGINGAQVGLDSATTVLSIIAQFLMLKRFAEQWIIWITVNVLSIVMWLNVFLTNGESVTILVMWSAFLVNSIYGWIKWKNAAKEQRGMGKVA